MLKISEKRNQAVCSKMTMALVALGVEVAVAQALVDPDKVDPDKVDPDNEDPDNEDPDKVDPDNEDPASVDPDKVAPVLAGVVRAAVEVQQEVVVA